MTFNRKSLFTFVLLGSLAVAGNGQDAAEIEANSAEIASYVNSFGNLSEEQRRIYFEHKLKVKQYIGQKRTFEALEEVHLGLKIFDEDPEMWNLLGACHVEFRSFDKAREAFEQALTIDSRNIGVLFNLAEMDFVTKRWKDCIQKMKSLSVRLEKETEGELEGQTLELHRLTIFKRLISHLKLDQVETAQKLAEEHWDIWDDTPFTYYTKATLAYHQGEDEEAVRWLQTAARVFGNLERIANWQDTLIEFGYVRSIYGESEESDVDISEE